MAEMLVRCYSGQGTLVFNESESASVTYRIDEFQNMVAGLAGMISRRGHVSHSNGHPGWHPLTLAHREFPTLIMSDGRNNALVNSAGNADVAVTALAQGLRALQDNHTAFFLKHPRYGLTGQSNQRGDLRHRVR
jgi:hypothetical protein